MLCSVPDNDVVAADGEVKGLGGVAKEGTMAAVGQEVKVVVDVIGVIFG